MSSPLARVLFGIMCCNLAARVSGVGADAPKEIECLRMFDDIDCITPRGRNTPSRPPLAQVCGGNGTCMENSDFKESYRVICHNNTGTEQDAFVWIWRTFDGCDNGENATYFFDIPTNNCTRVFGDVFVKVTCNDVPGSVTTTRSFVASLVVNLVIAAVVLILFEFFRKSRTLIYKPRCYMEGLPSIVAPSKKFFGWVYSAWTITDDQMFRNVGLDALMYTVLFRFAFESFAFCCLYGAAVLVPVNIYGDGKQSGLEAISLANINSESDNLWAHVISIYIGGIFFLWRLWKASEVYVHYKKLHMQAGHVHQRTLLVRDFPERITTEKALETMMGGKDHGITGVLLLRDTKKLVEISDERKSVQRKLERAKAINIKRKEGSERAQTRLRFCGERIDAEDHYSTRLAILNQQYKEEKERVLASDSRFTAGFVTYSTVEAARKARVTVRSKCLATEAPQPKDVFWKNVGLPYHTRFIQGVIFNILTALVIFFWIIPVGLVSALTSLESLSKFFGHGFQQFLRNYPSISGFLAGFMPSLVLMVFILILPMIMRALSQHQGYPSHGSIDLVTMLKLYIFQVVNIFFVSIIGGSAFNSLKQVVDDPRTLVPVLGVALPKTGTFFTSYVMLQSLTIFPLLLLQVWPVIWTKFKKTFLCITPREFEEADQPSSYNYAEYIPGNLLIILVGITYATVSPVILPFVTFYFAMGLATHRYMLYYVYVPKFETGGKFWHELYNKMMSAIVLAEITVMIILSVKKGGIQSGLVIPLILLTVIFWINLKKFLNVELNRHVKYEKVLTRNEEEVYRQPELLEVDTLEPEPYHTYVPVHKRISESRTDLLNLPLLEDGDSGSVKNFLPQSGLPNTAGAAYGSTVDDTAYGSLVDGGAEADA